MKKLLFVFLFLLPLLGRAQYATPIDSTSSYAKQLAQMKANMNVVQSNLGHYYKQHTQGASWLLAGVGLVVMGAYVSTNSAASNGSTFAIFGVMGGIAGLVGTINILDSYKYLARAAGLKTSKRKQVD